MHNIQNLPNQHRVNAAVLSDFNIVMPVFNHAAMVGETVRQAVNTGIPVIVVDDGSRDDTPAILNEISGIKVLRHPHNMGKGKALRTGFTEAAKRAKFAITIDADGQHYPDDAFTLINAIHQGTKPVVVGKRMGMDDQTVPWTSRFGRQFSNFWVRVCGGPNLSDSQSGFRIYPLPESIQLPVLSGGFQFEIEFLVQAHWQCMTIVEAPVTVNYRPGGLRISHFRPFADFMKNSGLFTRLIFQQFGNKQLRF